VTRSEQNANEIIVQLFDRRGQDAPDYRTERVNFSIIIIIIIVVVVVIITIIIMYPVLRQVHSLFQSKSSTESDLLFSFSICSILSFY
jgi:Kef-type K+ transport system membrane component KefB